LRIEYRVNVKWVDRIEIEYGRVGDFFSRASYCEQVGSFAEEARKTEVRCGVRRAKTAFFS
jgi:hypothetical protein